MCIEASHLSLWAGELFQFLSLQITGCEVAKEGEEWTSGDWLDVKVVRCKVIYGAGGGEGGGERDIWEEDENLRDLCWFEVWEVYTRKFTEKI